MERTEILEQAAKTLLNNETQVISADEFNRLVENASSQAERDFYLEIYNYLLGRKQQQVIRDAKF